MHDNPPLEKQKQARTKDRSKYHTVYGKPRLVVGHLVYTNTIPATDICRAGTAGPTHHNTGVVCCTGATRAPLISALLQTTALLH